MSVGDEQSKEILREGEEEGEEKRAGGGGLRKTLSLKEPRKIREVLRL